MKVQITATQHKLMNDQGFCIIDGVFGSDEMSQLASLIERYQRSHEERIAAQGGAEGISRANEITFTSHLAEHDPAIMEFCRRPEFVDITTQMLGPDVDLYWNQSVYKMPEGHKEFPWHQDDGYTEVDPSPYLTLWLAINDATPVNGCISALAGSHRLGLVPHTRGPLGLECHAADDPNQGVLVPVKAGSIAMFWSLTAHKSGANTSNEIRKAYIIQYAKAGLKRVDTSETIPNLAPVARRGSAAP